MMTKQQIRCACLNNEDLAVDVLEDIEDLVLLEELLLVAVHDHHVASGEYLG